jgi:hypothetical protein
VGRSVECFGKCLQQVLDHRWRPLRGAATRYSPRRGSRDRQVQAGGQPVGRIRQSAKTRSGDVADAFGEQYDEVLWWGLVMWVGHCGLSVVHGSF